MKIILTQDVEGVGKAGQILEVADGYGRNYLIPKGMAMAATSRSIAQVEHRKRIVADRIAKELKTAEAIKAKLESLSCKVAREAGEEDKLFGSVSARDIADALADEGVQIDHRQIQLKTPIRALGSYDVLVKLATDVVANVKVWVVAK
ncbi:MAG: 50S ribosomal protein L9 [Myxococcota bacterium]|jgi:large subunit ribosomal protein L9|nr:50S ribosomal protein L9 [Myxococcota bacterium]OQC43108.1 MAG: 50S ribosomal protein L9 [Deltaproteobacteria bacterium ADurb.Bin058]HHW97486.1 50S ribosomal protein L9 [Oligoflexales bacterium]MBP8970934.1 50S ribosomal protein L9 [Myxococcota bacterium]HOE82992.1 50S ribosomal protein L9 [Myxococcota bacterium]